MHRRLLLAVIVVIQAGFAGNTYSAETTPDVAAFRAELDATLPAVLDRFRIPGTAVAVIHDGEVVFRAGFTNHERTAPITPATVFNAASISKSVSAVGAMALVERGLLDLDRPIEGSIRGWHVPTSPFGDVLTLRRLLSHTAGLSVGAIGTYIVGTEMPSLTEELDGHAGRAPVTVRYPADEFHYSGGGYGVVQLLMTAATERPFTTFMRREILEPLGMHRSSYRWADVDEYAAVPHEGGRPVEPVTHVFEAGGSLQTTVDDLARFLLFVLGEADGPLAPETLDRMQRPPFGVGFNVSTLFGRRVVAHGAGNRGWSCQYGLLPDAKAGIAILTNGSSGTDITNTVLYAWTRHFHGFELGVVPTNEPEFAISHPPSSNEWSARTAHRRVSSGRFAWSMGISKRTPTAPTRVFTRAAKTSSSSTPCPARCRSASTTTTPEEQPPRWSDRASAMSGRGWCESSNDRHLHACVI